MPLVKLRLVFPFPNTDVKMSQCGLEVIRLKRSILFLPPPLWSIFRSHSRGQSRTVGHHARLRPLVVWANDAVLRGRSSGTPAPYVRWESWVSHIWVSLVSCFNSSLMVKKMMFPISVGGYKKTHFLEDSFLTWCIFSCRDFNFFCLFFYF